MRFAILLMVPVFAWSSPAGAGWDLLHMELGQDNAVVDLSMPDERSACAVGAWYPGGSGTNPEALITCTGDGGATWRQASLEGAFVLPSAVHMLDGQTGFLASFGFESFSLFSGVWKTVDGGRNWMGLDTSVQTDILFSDLFFLDSDRGWVCGGTGLWRTIDGGESWQQASLPDLGEDRYLEAVLFLDADHGFAVGGQPRVEGDEFTEASEPCCGFILESSDGGAIWQVVEEELEGSLHALSSPDAQHIWAAGGGAGALMMYSGDRGQSWLSQPIPTDNYGSPDEITDISAPSADVAVAVGNLGADSNPVVLRWDGQVWAVASDYVDAFEDLSGLDAFAEYSALFAVDFPFAGRGMVAGKNAVVVGLTDEGFCADLDADGHQDEACGGDDCDDSNPFVSPSAEESCNGLDENCDGIPDENFDLQRDPANCGECGFNCQPALVCWDGDCVMDCPQDLLRCGQSCVDPESDAAHCGECDHACVFAHAQAACISGQCQMGACLQGWVDLDGNAGTGCEYACQISGEETCNGQDDDCDGETDEDLTECGIESDAGVEDAGVSDGGTRTDPDEPGGGCSHGASGGLGALVFSLGLLVLRRREQNNDRPTGVED